MSVSTTKVKKPVAARVKKPVVAPVRRYKNRKYQTAVRRSVVTEQSVLSRLSEIAAATERDVNWLINKGMRLVIAEHEASATAIKKGGAGKQV